MVDHIDLSGTYHHDHNTDGIDSITSIIGPTMTTATIIASASAMASTSRMAVAVTLRKIALDCPGNYGSISYHFDIVPDMSSDFIDLCHVNCGL